MFQEKLNELRPYVTGLRFVKDLPVVDVLLNEGWDMFESDIVTYKLSNNNQSYFMVYPVDPNSGIDIVLNHVKHVIELNVERENKLSLLKWKIEELKTLFNERSLSELEKLKFVFDLEEEITLKEINNINNKNSKTHNGVELPPKKVELVEEKEKEEV
jgi:hypothetical protein